MQDLPLKGSPTRIRSTSNGVLSLLGVFMSHCTSNLSLSASARGLSCAVAFLASIMQVYVSKPELGDKTQMLSVFQLRRYLTTNNILLGARRQGDKRTPSESVAFSPLRMYCTWSLSRQCFCNASHVRPVCPKPARMAVNRSSTICVAFESQMKEHKAVWRIEPFMPSRFLPKSFQRRKQVLLKRGMCCSGTWRFDDH